MKTNHRLTHYGRMKLLRDQQMSLRPTPPADNEQQQAYYAVDMLLFIQCLLTATYDLTRALVDTEMYRHEAKRAVNVMDRIAAEVSHAGYKVFTRGHQLGNAYVERSEAAYKIIDNSVSGVASPIAVSKYKSIALALSELIGEYNDKLCPRFRFDAADRLKVIPRLLRSVPAEVNVTAPVIIRQNVTAKHLEIKITE